MGETTYDCTIMFSQLAVFNYGLQNPYNDWEDAHVRQGFSWREGSVSFGTLSSDAECKVTVRLSDYVEINGNVKRAIIVPFKVENGVVEIGSIMETREIEIPIGNYELLFTAEEVDGGLEHYVFTFIQSENPQPRTLVADNEIVVPDKYTMDAKPAT